MSLLDAMERIATEMAEEHDRSSAKMLLMRPQLESLLRREVPEAAPRADGVRTTFMGFPIVSHPHIPREPNWPEGVTRSKPDWLSDEGWARHRQWMGDFFGWVDVAYVVGMDFARPNSEHTLRWTETVHGDRIEVDL